LEKGPVRGAAPEAKVLGGIKTPKKCIVGIYFISFTAKNNALHIIIIVIDNRGLNARWCIC